MNNEKLKVAIYLRIGSYDKQEEEKQRKELQDYYKRNNYKTYKYYIDNGYSANDKNRPNYNLLLEDIKQKKIDLILVSDLSRLTRSITELYDFIDLLNKNNCKLKTLKDNQDILFLMTPFYLGVPKKERGVK